MDWKRIRDLYLTRCIHIIFLRRSTAASPTVHTPSGSAMYSMYTSSQISNLNPSGVLYCWRLTSGELPAATTDHGLRVVDHRPWTVDHRPRIIHHGLLYSYFFYITILLIVLIISFSLFAALSTLLSNTIIVLTKVVIGLMTIEMTETHEINQFCDQFRSG